MKIEAAIYDVAGMLLDYAREICDDLEREGYHILEEAVLDDFIRDFCTAHGILFDDGNRVYWDCENELEGNAGRVIFPTTLGECTNDY